MARIILPPQQEESEKPWRRGSSRPELDLTYSVQLYPRVSTKEQLKNISAEMQQDKSFARDYGWTDAQIIMDPADLGKSGQLRMDERSAFLGMLGRIRNGIVKTVIAAQVDRFFREKWGVEYGKFM
jgi:DNA invertase Pin-like site-specific DNA recombinase